MAGCARWFTTHNIWVTQQVNMDDVFADWVCSAIIFHHLGLVCTYSLLWLAKTWVLVSSRTEYLDTFTMCISVSNV